VSIQSTGGRPVPLTVPAGSAPPDRLVVPLSPLAAGTYVVRYRVLAADGHLTEGSLRFTIRSH
jgi:methionine-rich copper-binding protein CopC